MNNYSTNLTLLVLLTIFTLCVIDLTLPLIAGPYIVGDLGGSRVMAIYDVCFFGYGNALGIPIGRILSQKIGAVKVLWICTTLYGICSLLCALMPTYPAFVAIRFLQGIVVGPIFIIIGLLFYGLAAQNQKSAFTSISLTIYTIGPPAGACLGGWIAYDYHWRWFFYIDFALLSFLAITIAILLRGYQQRLLVKPFDTVGYFFYSIAICCLGFALTTGQEFDWFRSSLITGLILLGTSFLIFFLLRSLYCPHPLFQFKLLKKPLFFFGIINEFFLYGIYFGTIVLLSFWLHLYVNYTPEWIGLIMGIMIIMAVFPVIFLREQMKHIDARIPLLISIILLAVSSFYTTIFNADINFERIAISRVLAGAGLVFFLPSIFRICFETIPPQQNLLVLPIFQVCRVISSSLGAALFIILFQRRQVFYHDRLGSKLTHFSEQTKDFFSKAEDVFILGHSAYAKLDDSLIRAATSLALDDCFYLMGWLLIGLVGLLGLTLFLPYQSGSKDNEVINIFLARK